MAALLSTPAGRRLAVRSGAEHPGDVLGNRSAVVVGAGVVGLTAALGLLDAGWSVVVVTDRHPMRTTSSVAAAVWFPTLAAPRERAARWSRDTYCVLLDQAQAGVPGVVMRESLALYRTPPPQPWWADGLDGVRPARSDELPVSYPHGLRFAAPLVEMSRYLPWLIELLGERGGRLDYRILSSLDEIADADLIVHSSGLGARQLVDDRTVVPVRGQVVRVANPGLHLSVRDEHHPRGRAYVHPRSDDCILGGTFDEGQWDTTPDPRVTEAIVARCAEIVPAVRGAEVLEVLVGLRPTRPTVRLEAQPATATTPRTIHNYGHGGSGITMSWGCAAEVVALADAPHSFMASANASPRSR